MAPTGRNKPPLVAEKRYPAQSAGAKKPSANGTKRKKTTRKPARRRPKTFLGRVAAFFIGILTWILRLVWRIGRAVALVSAAILAGFVIWYASTMPPVAERLDARARGSVTFLDRDRDVFSWRGEQYGGAITTETVSKHLKNAIVATEDRRFYKHFGVSPRGVASAVRINLSEGRGPLSGHGGSTITQQTAKLLCLGVDYDPSVWKTEAEYESDCRRTTITRKLKEAVYAMAMELRYSKDEILTIYLNRAYMGAQARGVEAAAER